MPNQIAPGLFPELPVSVQLQNKHPEAHHHDPNAPARVLSPNRLQIELHPSNLESLLPEGHHARLVWRYVEQQNLEGLYDIMKARQGGAGRSAIAPEILFALWLYATIDDIGSSGNSSANHLADEMCPSRWRMSPSRTCPTRAPGPRWRHSSPARSRCCSAARRRCCRMSGPDVSARHACRHRRAS